MIFAMGAGWGWVFYVVCVMMKIEPVLISIHRHVHPSNSSTRVPPRKAVPRPVVWHPSRNLTGDAHTHRDYVRVSEVMKMAGFYFGDETTNWSILHGRTFFMNMKISLTPVPKKNQKVNFVPGLAAITNKHDFLSSNITGTLPSFFIPKQRKAFREYVKENPSKKWIRKTLKDRGIGTMLVRDIDRIIASGSYQSVQEYVSDPFLVYGRKIVAAVFVIITSIKPLRAYVDNTDWVVRVSGRQYYPFDPTDKDAYAGWTDFISTLPFLDESYETFKLTNKELLLHYIRDRGFDSDAVERKVLRSIVNVLSESEKRIVKMGNELVNDLNYKTKPRGYYETVRFDFVFDNALNAYICEVQGPPAMRAEGLPQFIQKYQRIFYNIMKINEVANFHDSSVPKSELPIGHLSVNAGSCLGEECKQNCSFVVCELCLPCLSEDELTVLYQSYTEHIHKTDFTQLIPEPFQNQWEASRFLKEKNVYEKGSVEYANKWLRTWFAFKCEDNDSWCF